MIYLNSLHKSAIFHTRLLQNRFFKSVFDKTCRCNNYFECVDGKVQRTTSEKTWQAAKRGTVWYEEVRSGRRVCRTCTKTVVGVTDEAGLHQESAPSLFVYACWRTGSHRRSGGNLPGLIFANTDLQCEYVTVKLQEGNVANVGDIQYLEQTIQSNRQCTRKVEKSAGRVEWVKRRARGDFWQSQQERKRSFTRL